MKIRCLPEERTVVLLCNLYILLMLSKIFKFKKRETILQIQFPCKIEMVLALNIFQ